MNTPGERCRGSCDRRTRNVAKTFREIALQQGPDASLAWSNTTVANPARRSGRPRSSSFTRARATSRTSRRARKSRRHPGGGEAAALAQREVGLQRVGAPAIRARLFVVQRVDRRRRVTGTRGRWASYRTRGREAAVGADEAIRLCRPPTASAIPAESRGHGTTSLARNFAQSAVISCVRQGAVTLAGSAALLALLLPDYAHARHFLRYTGGMSAEGRKLLQGPVVGATGCLGVAYRRGPLRGSRG